MDAFSYLSVLLSIILGLAVQQVLQGYRALILSRRRVTFYWPPLVWSALILLMVAQHWWASFDLANHENWSFAAFATLLVLTGLIYMMAAIVLPDVPPDEPLDLKAHYDREAPAFFGLGAATVAFSVVRELVLEGRLPEPANLGFHLLFFGMSLTAALVRNRRLHEFLAAAMGALFVIYVALLFARLET